MRFVIAKSIPSLLNYVFFKYPVCFEVLLDEKVSECFLSIKYKWIFVSPERTMLSVSRDAQRNHGASNIENREHRKQLEVLTLKRFYQDATWDWESVTEEGSLIAA